MAKPKNPLLSLGAQGSIGDALTYQRRGHGTIARKKPTPANPQSLAQMYHRWLYEDYAYLWRQQSLATQQEYRSEGAKRHLTGFSHWMSVMLTDLPDIAAFWHLDEKVGPLVRDYSRNSNHATIFGAIPAAGLIDGAFIFDSLNDQLLAPSSPSLNITDELTLSALIIPGSLKDQGIVGKYDHWVAKRQYLLMLSPAGRFEFRLSANGIVATSLTSLTPYLATLPYSAIARWDGTTMRFVINGIPDANTFPFAGPIFTSDSLAHIGSTHTFAYFDGIIDHVIIANRYWDDEECLRHSQRRYPLE